MSKRLENGGTESPRAGKRNGEESGEGVEVEAGFVYLNGTEISESSTESRDAAKQEDLWKGTLEILREGGWVE